jgi:hypothetical protein
VDLVALIVTALAAGAAVQGEKPDAVKSVHAGLRDAVRRRLAGQPGGELALARFEADPHADRAPLERELAWAGAGDDADLVAVALALMELTDSNGKYAVPVSGARGVQVGDHNVQLSYFIQAPVGQRWIGSTGGEPAGRPLAGVSDPFALEVHRPVQADNPLPGLPALPPYVVREHDRQVAEVARAAADGTSGIAVLVGGSSTGKTRACWESLRLLWNRPEWWRLWHPIDPTRPEAALRELPMVGPRTVVWLNEAQFYLDVERDELGERIAAGLREALRDPDRGPVLVLATLWPEHWDTLTARPPAGSDPHGQARELLAGRDITVPPAFTVAQLRQASAARDPRLDLAAEVAADGRVTQFLAGAPELMARYRNAPPAGAAMITAAMDARRLGMGVGLPLAFLERAAPSYLTDIQWDGLGEDWLEQALAYIAAPVRGIPGPLTRIRSRRAGDADRSLASYRLADYLEQHGRSARHAVIPPPSFWEAAARHAEPRDLSALAAAAGKRGMLRDAARLRKHATAQGNVTAAADLVIYWHLSHATDPRPAQWAAVHVALDDPFGVAHLLDRMRRAGANQQVTVLTDRAAAYVSLDDPVRVVYLLDRMRRAGANQQVTVLTDRAAAHIPLDNPRGVTHLLGWTLAAGMRQQVNALLARDPATHVSLDDPGSVAALLDIMREAGADQQVTVLTERAAAHVPLDDPFGIAYLLSSMQKAGADQQVTVLLARDPATHVSLDSPNSVGYLLYSMRKVGADQQVNALLARDPATHVSLDDPGSVAALLDIMREAGADQQVTVLSERAFPHIPLDRPFDVADLLHRAWKAGLDQRVCVLADRAAGRIPLDNPRSVAYLLDGMWAVGASQQVNALLARDPASHVSLDDPGSVAALLDIMREAGVDQQVNALLARDPASHVSLDDPFDVASLVDGMRAVGASQQVNALLARDPAAHVSLDDPRSAAALLDIMREAGADQQVNALLARDPAAHVSLDDPRSAAVLLGSMRKAGAGQQAIALAARAAAHIPLDAPGSVAPLLDSMREGGLDQEAKVLVDRLPAEGLFGFFREQPEHAKHYKFGREFDGSPASRWGWDHLD